ncbi:MAG: TetR/AcrR family transcriptional regulator [Spirochaetes bacterium]|nr:TetR/AcrR family transcriptional regulator [Spirochaetota bacterium]
MRAKSDRSQWDTNRLEKKKKLKQQQMIDMAERLFIQHGFENTTMDMIAEETGYTVRSLYLYFRDRDDIFAAVTLRALDVLLDKMKHSVGGKTTGYERLMAIADAYFTYFRDYPAYFEFNRIFEVHTYYYNRPVKEEGFGVFVSRCQEVNDQITDLLIESIELGQEDGSIKNSMGSKKLMLLLWGATFGLLQIIRIRQNHLNDVYDTNEEELFGEFIKTITRILGV